MTPSSAGVAIYPLGLAVVRYALDEPADNPLDQVALPGFAWSARTQYYAAYATAGCWTGVARAAGISPLTGVRRGRVRARRRAGAAAVGRRQRAALGLQRRRGAALRAAARSRCSGGNLDPGGYFANPPAFTYLLAGLFELWFGGRTGRIYYSDHSTELWLIARVTSGVLGTLAVWLLYLAGARLFDRRTGLLAAAVMAVAFLPVFYGKLALNDSPTLAPVCLSLWGSAGIVRFGRRRDFVVAGLGLGLAAATKYTGGIVVLPLLAAGVSRLCARSRRAGARRCGSRSPA